ncbi:MAG: elongation factor G [Rhodospirillales bacterium]|nr:elongation factor G [Rhodospirillales bacterium]MBT4041243.1 elongation factor G [Rhodospirillales bacterium]MBT4626470.1 elongation factor G [Rhodospirillales bacterium]MBT5350347.1 elongation factor G [Rhodospirillales bacterium]MBT5519708.1 elongation factor G [Rhodospirillales bacterium]
MSTKNQSTPRIAAIVGPYLSGKTSLLESMLVATGVVHRKGSIRDGNTLGDSSREARDREMGTEVNIVSTDYLGDQWTFLDCPGSVELSQDAIHAMTIADITVVVAEPDPKKSVTISPILKALDAAGIPHMIFINKMDLSESSVRQTMESLQNVSAHPLVMREVPIREEGAIVGHVDLVSERAFRWREGKPSELIQLPEGTIDREQGARTEMLESLADFDDTLLEELLEDVIPSTDEVYSNLVRDLQSNLIVPVFFGSAEHDNGVVRLLKALRHETAEVPATAERLGIDTSATSALVFKTIHAGQVGKLSIARVMGGTITDGMALNGERVSGIYHMTGPKTDKLARGVAGDMVALGRMDTVHTGDLLTEKGGARCALWPKPLEPLFSMAVHAADRADEVKLSVNLQKIVDEDTSLSFGHDGDTGELLLWGQGEIHLSIVLARLTNRYNVSITSARPQVPYKETIQKPTSQHSRHKKQSGGHGEFGDVHIEIKPLPRGSGFDFSNTVTGGAVPRQYIPAVETGVKEYLPRGPLGFSVVDLAVTLTDGQHHAVDSSEMAFKKAAQQAMREGMPNCGPVLLEPICTVTISMPDEFTSNIQRLVSGRRGHILGFDAKEGWPGWDEVQAHIPQVEMHDMIIELRSMTQGVGTFAWAFDHLQELSGKLADNVVSERQNAAS